MQWKTDGRQYAQSFHSNPLTFRVKKHQSVLIRKLGDSEQRWQKNKVINLKIASERISTILIKPNETFSFCQLVGLPTIKQGYVEGMELSFGQARGGIGGGICQIANLIHWFYIVHWKSYSAHNILSILSQIKDVYYLSVAELLFSITILIINFITQQNTLFRSIFGSLRNALKVSYVAHMILAIFIMSLKKIIVLSKLEKVIIGKMKSGDIKKKNIKVVKSLKQNV